MGIFFKSPPMIGWQGWDCGPLLAVLSVQQPTGKATFLFLPAGVGRALPGLEGSPKEETCGRRPGGRAREDEFEELSEVSLPVPAFTGTGQCRHPLLSFPLSLNKNVAKTSARATAYGPGVVVDIRWSANVWPYLPVCINKIALAATAKCHRHFSIPPLSASQSLLRCFWKPREGLLGGPH